MKLCIVIPCFREQPWLILDSLAQSNGSFENVEVILVLNHSENAKMSVKELHARQALEFEEMILPNAVSVKTITAFDLPAKNAGVGLARKIGMDMALNRFASIDHDGMIVCLDADCTVSVNYLDSLLALEKSNANGASIAFEHMIQDMDSKEDAERIIDYEIFLRYYVSALRHSHYPHAFHTIGSSMAVRASAYAKIGGMNQRKAGEDFYFLHKLIPQGRFYDLTSCTVFPSARVSDRVPFGTGKAMMQMQAQEKDFKTLYHPSIFEELRIFLKDGPEVLYSRLFENLQPHMQEFLRQGTMQRQIEDLVKRSRDLGQFQKNFFHWFDGFKVLKYVHFCRDNFYPNIAALHAGGELLNKDFKDEGELLQYLRTLDRNSAFTISAGRLPR